MFNSAITCEFLVAGYSKVRASLSAGKNFSSHQAATSWMDKIWTNVFQIKWILTTHT